MRLEFKQENMTVIHRQIPSFVIEMRSYVNYIISYITLGCQRNIRECGIQGGRYAFFCEFSRAS